MKNKTEYKGNYIKLTANYSPEFNNPRSETYFKYKHKQFKGLFSNNTSVIKAEIATIQDEKFKDKQVILNAKDINLLMLKLFNISSNIRIPDHVIGNYLIYTGNSIIAKQNEKQYQFDIISGENQSIIFSNIENFIEYVLKIYKKICESKEEELIKFGCKPNSILNQDI